MYNRLLVWVTSDCNLKCKWCAQAFTMTSNLHYQMGEQEIHDIVASCGRRGLRFNVIELVGGECSLWNNLEYGVKMFSSICDQVTLTTNGNDPERIKALGLKTWTVSESQATPEQMSHYESMRSKLTINAHAHRKPPVTAVKGCLPAQCCTRIDPLGEPQNVIMYMKGKVYYCCNVFPISEYVKLTPAVVCDFEEDFLSKFKDKKFYNRSCSYCICNTKVWNGI